MPAVYLDGIKLAGSLTSLVLRAAGPFTEICPFCGGSMFEVKRIQISSGSQPITICAWCVTCGAVTELPYHYPRAWHERLMKRLEQLDN